MSDAERMAQLEERVGRLEREILDLSHRLDRAVLLAAERGDTLAQRIKAGKAETVLGNLVAHFEAIGEQEPQT